MRVVVAGAGGVGGLIGGMLARSGVPVGFLARGAQLAALRADGLHVESPRGTFHLPRVEASDDPAALAPADAVLVAVKAWQVPALASSLAPLLGRGGFVVPLENGIDAADTLARAVGEERVVGGLCHLSSWLAAPGHVRHIGNVLRVTVGERRGGSSARIEALAAALRAAGVEVVVAEDVEAASWEKFLFIAASSGVGAVARAPVGVVRATPETRALLVAALEEVATLARARGVRLAGDAVARALAIVDGFPPETTPSMQKDVQAGRPSELQDQTGAVVRMARAAGVPAPVNGFLLAALLPQERLARGGAS